MMDLHETVNRLERQVGRIQTLQYVLLAIIFLLIGLVVVYAPQFGGAESMVTACSKFSEDNTLPGKGI